MICLRKISRLTPLSVKMISLSLFVAIIIGTATHFYIEKFVGDIFGAHLDELLKQQSQEDRLRFDRYMKIFHQT